MKLFFSSLFNYCSRSIVIRGRLKNSFVSCQAVRQSSNVQNNYKYLNNELPFLTASTLMTHHKENTFSHGILESKSKFNVVSYSELKDDLLTVDKNLDIDKVINDPNLANFSSKELIQIFKMVSIDSSTNSHLPISNSRYDKLCKAILSKVPELSDCEIGSLLLYLSVWPMSESSKAEGFFQLWKALDNACLDRYQKWNFDKILYFIDMWYLLKLTRMSDFVFKSLLFLHRKVKQLNPQQVVQTLFYFNTVRLLHKSIKMYDFEYKLEAIADELSLEELGVALLGFFKTQTIVRSEDFIVKIIDRTISEIDTVPEITLASILKCLRLSMKIKVWDKLPKLLDALLPQLDRFSLQCLSHVSLLTAPSQTFHPQTLDFVSQRLLKDIKESRLKDMEKVLFPLSRLNYNPHTEVNIFERVVQELSLDSRQEEIEMFPKCFIALIHCLAVLSIFPYKLISKAMNMEFITKTYGSKKFHFGREIAFLDTCIELECKDYTGPRLPRDIRTYLYKRYSKFKPGEEYALSKHDELSIDILTSVQGLLGRQSAKFLYTVPSHPRYDIVLRPSGLPEDFRSIPEQEGPIPAPTGNDTTCIVVVSKNMLCPPNNDHFNGETMSKLRSISLLGYKTKVISFSAWKKLTTLTEKESYLERLLSVNDPY